MFVITAERPGDAAAIDILLDRAFGPDRHGKIAYRYRRGVKPVAGLSLVAHDAADASAAGLVGSIRYWPVVVGGEAPALLLGPLAVEPARRGESIGHGLIRRSMAMAAAAGHRAALLVGEISYYGQFGFDPAPPRGLDMPGEAPHRLLVAALAADGLAGLHGRIGPAPEAHPAADIPCCTARLPA
ncbi:MAG: N-acetyltransferase [Inquilinus sp.]|nr:N-acetyltransferase [Inquilinus sp.]